MDKEATSIIRFPRCIQVLDKASARKGNINITRKTTGNRVLIVKARVLPNGEGRGKEAEREQKQ